MPKFEILIAIVIVFLGATAIIGPIELDVASGEQNSETSMETNTSLNVPLQTAGNGWHESDPVNAPIPFNAIVIEWTDDHSIYFEVRTGKNGIWSDWAPLTHSHDLSDGEEVTTAANNEGLAVGDMMFVSAADVTHTAVQFRTVSPISEIPTVRLTAIDTTDGPSSDDLLQRQQELDALTAADTRATQNNPKPTVISRDVWCTDARCECPPEGCGNTCTDTDPLRYEEVTHMVVHHTVSNNASVNWAATMRAIWTYHTFGQCWGDIGYNYLIDMNGNIYEGHRGGDNVIGTHAAGANTGSMGVALMGTFSSATESNTGMIPPTAMQNSLIDILAWKAEQQQIEVYGASKLPYLSGGRTHIMGHRDVYGTTQCPGGAAHALLPEIRDQVASRLGFVPEHLYIDELSDQFTQSNNNWYEPIYNCGYNTHSYYTFSTSNQNATPYWGEWEFNVPRYGLYEVEVFVPNCNTGEGETNSALYTIYHGGGNSQVTIDQQDRVGLWTSLGEYWLTPDTDNRLRLTDITQDNGNGVWFDTIRLRSVEPQAAFQINSPNNADTWLNNATVNFSWSNVNHVNTANIRLDVATDTNFTNIVLTENYSPSTTSATLNVSSSGTYYWRLSTNSAGEDIVSDTGVFNVDQSNPTLDHIQVVFVGASQKYIISYTAADPQSGIAEVDVQYRQAGQSGWLDLVSNTQANGVTFTPPNSSETYEFRVRITDQAGNVRQFPSSADTSTASAIRLDQTVFLSRVSR